MNYRIVGPSLIVFIIVSMIGILLLGFLLRLGTVSNNQNEVLGSILFGSLVGLMTLAAIWSGLFGQSWIQSYLEAVGLAILAITLLFIDTVSKGFTETYLIFFFVPLFGVTLSIPLWCMRYLRGWRLLCELPPPEHNRAMGIEDILLVTTVIASAIMLSRSAFGLVDLNALIREESIWLTIAIASVICSLIVTPFSLISARVTLTVPRFHIIAGTMFACWLPSWLSLILLFAAIGLMTGELAVYLFLATSSAFTVLGIGLACIVFDGNRLFYNKTASKRHSKERKQAEWQGSSQNIDSSRPEMANPVATIHDPFSDDDSFEIRRERFPSRMRDRLLAAGLLLSGFAFSFGAYLKERAKANEADLLAESLRNEVAQLESFGEVEIQNGSVFGFKARPAANDDAIQLLSAHDLLYTLDLSNSKVTNQGAAQAAQFINLETLDLSDTAIDDSVFDSLPTGKFQLKSLNLSRTKVTGTGLKKIANKIRCEKLILKGLNLTTDEIDKINFSATLLDLRGVQLSAMPRHAKYICLGQNGLPPESICDLSRDLNALQIDSLDVTDEIFDRFIKTHPMLNSISLSNTPQTGKSLAALNSIPNVQKLCIGEGTSITEKDLIDQQPSVRVLEIHDPSFQGSFLNSLSSTVQILDLSHSGVDDRAILNMNSKVSQHCTLIRLAHTKVSHETIKYLSSIGIGEIDIRGTQVSAQELAKLQFQFPSQLIIESNQFTDRERAKLNESTNFRITFKPSQE